METNEVPVKTFYWYLRPIVIFLQLLGTFPLDNVFKLDVSKIRFRYFSWSFGYSCVTIGFVTGMLVRYSGFMLQMTTSPQRILCVVIYGMCTRSFMTFIVYGLRSYHELPRMIQILDTYDRRKLGVIMDVDNKWKAVMKYTVLPMLTLTLMIASYLNATSWIIRDVMPDQSSAFSNFNKSSSAYCFAFLMNWQLLPIFLYVYFAFKIGQGFKELNRAMIIRGLAHDYVDPRPQMKYPEDVHETLSKIRLLHNMLGESVQQLGKVFGLFVAMDKFCIIFVLVTNTTVYVLTEQHNVNLLVLTVLNGMMMICMLWASENVKQSGSKVVDLLHGIPMSALSEKGYDEVMLFLTQIIARPVRISANGYFEVDKYQISSIISSVATYVIVALQVAEGQGLQTSNSTSSILF